MKRLGIFLALLLVVLCAVPASAASLEVAGKSAVLMDMATGKVLYEQNAHEKLPPASVTKVMTMLLIMEAIDSGRIGWEDVVTVSEAAAAKGGSQIYLKVGEQMTVSDMLKSVAVSSANDCACALAEHIAGSESAFVEQMNIRAGQLKMYDTNFVNCTGLDDDINAKEHLTSAYDIAVMSRELMVNHPDIQKFTTIWMDTVRNGAFGLSNTNKLIRFYPGATGLKTGFTSAAGYCLSATARRDGMGLIAVIMGAKTSQERFAGCKTMLDYGFANFALVRPEIPGDNEIPVTLGTKKTVRAIPGEQIELLIDKAQKNQVNIKLELADALAAPVSKGQKIGTLTVRAGEQVLSQVPMVAAEAVPKLTWWELFVQLLQKIAMAKQ
ncbi:MAG: D-alanyl-D-alanine carboxypeptidase [Ruminococcaceae bacterium]|nr:D-alanyl-D-alanine carboxypeptidase [Oscillospiraceae bacterium]